MKKCIKLVLPALLLCGCQLNISYDLAETGTGIKSEPAATETESTPAESGTVGETESEGGLTVTLPEASSSDVPGTFETDSDEVISIIPNFDFPFDENGEWADYRIIFGDSFVIDMKTDALYDFGAYGFTYSIKPLPGILVSDQEKQILFNEKLVEYIKNDFATRFQLKDMKVELECIPHNLDSRFVSFEFKGNIYHYGDGTPYQDEKEYRFFFTVDRFTMEKVNMDTVYGTNKLQEDIENGKYTVVEGYGKAFERFKKDMLARAYLSDPLLSGDEDHYYDFYLDDGKLCVCIWVGNENGGYAVLKLNDIPRLVKEKDRPWPPQKKSIEEIQEESEQAMAAEQAVAAEQAL